MYSNHFVLAIRANGKILREQKETVTLPFGCEYEVILKNLNSRQAMVSLSIDGKDVTPGRRLIVPANSTEVIERFIHNGNMNAGNRFKFIERTGAVEAHRGVGTDDGLVRAEFWLEKETVEIPIIKHTYTEYEYPEWPPEPPRWPRGPRWGRSGIYGSSQRGLLRSNSPQASAGPRPSFSVSETSAFNYSGAQGSATPPGQDITIGAMNCNVGATGTLSGLGDYQKIAEANDAGITVPGSESHQQFHHASGFALESTSKVLILHLKGSVDGVPVSKPVTVEYKPECTTCGKKNSAFARFCEQCGTALHIL